MSVFFFEISPWGVLYRLDIMTLAALYIKFNSFLVGLGSGRNWVYGANGPAIDQFKPVQKKADTGVYSLLF